MKKLDAIVVLTALAVAVVVRAASAGDESRIGIKIGFSVSGYPSDKDILTAPFKAIDDSPAIFDSRTVMQYHFDRKFGKTGYGAVTYAIRSGVELEMGFGYTDLQLEITQHGKTGRWDRNADPPEYNWTLFDYATQKGGKFSYMTFRPGLNLLLASKSWLVPYVGVGLDIIRVKGKTNLDFSVPYVTQEGPNYYLNSRTERLDFEGSSVVFGLDLASGLEFVIAPGVSANFGVSYMFQFNGAFGDFGSMVKDNPAAPVITDVQYYFDGMVLSNVSFTLGFIFHL
ncbi:MAG: hypothetical protein WC674_09510 [Candidatus Krumholzibacteriia bacterium]